MKKIKLFITVALCAFCLCFAFAGCATDGAYVNGSFGADYVQHYSYSNELHVSGSFEVELHKAGKYTVEYELCQNDTLGNTIAKIKGSEFITKNAETDKTAHTIYIDKYISTTSNSPAVTIRNVKVTLDSATPYYNAYAIGFGIAGALLLCGLVVIFVLDKLGKLTKLK